MSRDRFALAALRREPDQASSSALRPFSFWSSSCSSEGILGARPPHGTLTSVCENANLKSDPASVDPGSSGEVGFACAFTPSFVPAFTVGGLPPGHFVKAQATVNGFVAPYASLWIYDARDNTPGPCANRGGHLQIPSGKTLKILTGDWNYCAEFLNVGQAGLPTFSVSWTVS